MTYTELKTAIEQYAEDFEASFVQNVDTFIQLAESRVALRVRLPNFRKDNNSLAATAHNNLLAVPADFLAPDSLVFLGPGGWTPLLNKDSEFIDEMYPDPGFEGLLRYYCYLNEGFLKLGPRPDLGYALHLGYFYQPPSIVTAGSTWLGDHFAHALLSGSLVEAAIYMKSEDEMFQRYKLMFDADLEMDLMHAKGRTKKDTYQEPDVRVPA
jgi:hypothetical protein